MRAMLRCYVTRLRWQFCGQQFHATHVVDAHLVKIGSCDFRRRHLQRFIEELVARDPFAKRATLFDMGEQIVDASYEQEACELLAVDLAPMPPMPHQWDEPRLYPNTPAMYS